ncbi:MAG: IPTL-CTERM sorting domain-containing protein [Planctomycetota bacterium]
MRAVAMLLVVVALAFFGPQAMGQDGGARGPDGGLVEAVGGTGGDVFYDVVETSGGGVVAVGYTESDGAGNKDVLLVKFTTDGCGEILWKKTLGGGGDEEGRSIIEDSGGNLVVTGITTSVGGAGEHLLISRFTSLGVELWTTVLTDPSGTGDFYQLRGYDVIQDSSGDFVVTGVVWDDIGQLWSLLLAKFDTNGDLVLKRGFRGLASPLWDYWGNSLVEACSGDYMIVGGMVRPSDDNRRVLLVRIGPLMAIGWGRWMQEAGDVSAVGHSITLNHNDEPLITGQTGDDLFISKRNCDGTQVGGWQKKLTPGTTEGYSIIEESFSPYNLVVTGQYGSPPGQVLVSRWTAALDLVGSRFWTWGDPEHETGYAVVEDVDQRLWVAGETSSWGAGGQDGLLAKLDADGHVCVDETGFLTTPGDWGQNEDNHTLTALLLTPVEELDWDVNSADATQLQQFFECDDECEEECCFEDGTCAFLTPDDCEAANGTPQGAGTTCDPAGACCLPDGSCIITTETCCEALGVDGTYQGDGTDCLPTGACLLPDLTCPITTEACCLNAGGVYQGDGTTECPPPIPTVSEWGLIIMTLLLLTAGTVVFGRRYRAAAA